MLTVIQFEYARVAKLADAPDLGSGVLRRVGSTPTPRTILYEVGIMYKMIQIFVLFLFVVLFSGCDQKVLYPKKAKSSKKSSIVKSKKTSQKSPAKKSSVKSKSKKTSDVTVGDTIDYATGGTPLRTKRFIKNQLNKSYKTRSNK